MVELSPWGVFDVALFGFWTGQTVLLFGQGASLSRLAAPIVLAVLIGAVAYTDVKRDTDADA